MKTVAVTGVTGKTGCFFLKRLCLEPMVVQDYSFRFASRTKESLDFIESQMPSSKAYIGSIENRNFCESLCAGVEILIHIAGIRSSFPLLDVAAECGIKRLILVHTTGMYSKYKKAARPYIDLEKRIYELASDNGILLTILRPTMIYGTLDDKNVSIFIRMVDKLRLFPVIGGAKYELHPVHARDLGIAYYKVLTQPEATAGKSYNLSGGAPIMLIDMLKEITRGLDKKTVFLPVPFWFAYSGACMLYIITLKKFDYREKVQRMVEPRVFDHEQAAIDFGYEPVKFEDGVKDEIAQYLKLKNKS